MRPRTLLVVLASTLALAACTAGGGALPLPLPAPGPVVTVQEGPAPSSTVGDLTLRADQATRSGNSVGLGLTIGVTDGDKTIYPASLIITTNSGIQVPAAFTQRTIPSNSLATVSLSVPLPEAGVSSLTLQVERDGPEITIPLPPEDGTWAWRPAAVRQIGLAQTVIRSKEVEYVLDTIRSAGVTTEVTYHAQGLGQGAPDVCRWNFQISRCVITESDGTVHPLLATDLPKTNDNERITGTLRFLGELKADARELKLSVTSSLNQVDTVPVLLPSHADSPAVAAAGDLARPMDTTQKVKLKGAGKGVSLVVDQINVLSDRVQVRLVGTGGPTPYPIIRGGTYLNDFDATVAEPSGVIHYAMGPKDANIIIPAKGKLEATLTFPGSIPADVTHLTLRVGVDRYGRNFDDGAATGKLTIPPAQNAQPPAGATFAEVEPSPPVVAVTPTAVPPATDPSATAAPSQAGVLSMQITALPITGSTSLGIVRSSIKGYDSAAETAEGEDVNANDDAKAQRSLEDLGAKKTPEGWVLTLPETVLFEFNKADLLPVADATVSKVTTLLTYYSQAEVAVQGHTDNVGGVEYNLDLSKRRAQAVANRLASGGVAPSRMTVAGLGESKPVASNGTDEGRGKNRRVEIVLREDT